MSKYLPGPGAWPFIVPALILLAIVVIGGRRLACREPEIPESPPADTLSDSAIQRELPDTQPPGGLGRIARVPVRVRRSVSRGTPDTALANRYARAVDRGNRFKRERDSLLALVTTRADSDSVSRETPPEPPAILPPVAGRYDGKRLDLYLTLSSGRMMRATARVRPRFEFTAGRGGSTDTLPLIVQDRWWVRTSREVIDCAPLAALAALAGAVLDGGRGAAIGGGLAEGACVLGD